MEMTEPRRRKSGSAPSARFQRTERTRIWGEYSLPGPTRSPSLSNQTPKKRVGSVRIGPIPPTKQTRTVPNATTGDGDGRARRLCGGAVRGHGVGSTSPSEIPPFKLELGMSSSSGAEQTLTPPTEQQANAPIAAMDAKLMVATASGNVQQLKDLVVKKQDSSSNMMVVVMAKQQAAASTEKPHQGNMDPHLLALASSGSYEELKSFLCADSVEEVDGVEGSLPMQRASDGIVEGNVSILEGITAEGHTTSVCASSCEKTQTLANAEEGEVRAYGTDGSLHMRQASNGIVEANQSVLEGVVAEGDIALGCSSSFEKRQTLVNPEEGQTCDKGTDDESLHMRRACDDIEANELILEGVTAQGDTALHVVAACGQGDDFFTRWWRWRWHGAYGDGENFSESARIIYVKAKHLLFVENNKGDTPLHCAARAGKSNMVKYLIRLARAEGEGRVKELLRKQNKDKETALHGAVRIGNKYIVELLMEEDCELATFPQDGGASPVYLAFVLRRHLIWKTMKQKSHGKLSFSGPHGQNALHAAVLRYRVLPNLLKWNEAHLCLQNKELITQGDENGSTPLHFAAAIKFRIRFGPSGVCQQVLEANADALYQSDHAGFFPIHIAASVGASKNVDMFVTKFPGSAGLRDAKGRTFLHIAVEKKKLSVIRSACRNLSLSWIMNMVDNDGNTALHLAVESGNLQMFCPLLGNPQVNLNLPNSRGETPLDIAEYNITKGLPNHLNNERVICGTLRITGAVKGVRCQDHFENEKTVRVKHDKCKETEVLKDSTQNRSIGSVLIATVTFGATFAVPGGYIADDHNNGGSPILARRYAFDAFTASNTLAFVFSTVATVALMKSGTPFLNPWRRMAHFAAASYLVVVSITCLAAAFALGAYVVLAPVAHKTAVATCVLTSLVPLYTNLEFIWVRLLLLPPLSTRKGLICAWLISAYCILANILVENWPLIFIFGWAAHANRAHIQKIEAAAQAPAPLQA